jgi:L-seryl-tRNA(Ser) seleniumtransferase
MSAKALVLDAEALRNLPSVDETLRHPTADEAVAQFGRAAVLAAIRAALADARARRASVGDARHFASLAQSRLIRAAHASLRPVFNLTGTVLHTNLGRALLGETAVEAAVHAMREAVSLEFDVAQGRRGDRDDHVRALLCELTGAEDATVVNNNAAAVLLVLNTFARGREAIVSRGELIEIGGAFRMPDIMARAGAKLVEVGTTNRTHPTDYADAIGHRTGLVLKVHTSNYRIEGFTSHVGARELASILKDCDIPLVNDLGSGTLIDLRLFGLPPEPTVGDALAEGADLVTFSGDKLLGGPQTGFVVGRKDLIARLNRNPLKRALRVDKLRLAALVATLKLYRNPDTLATTLPTLRMLARPLSEIEAVAQTLSPEIAAAIGPGFAVKVEKCVSQIGSGALPVETIPSACIAIRPFAQRSGRALTAVAKTFRQLPVPVIGRVEDGALVFDLRCLADEKAFIANLADFAANAQTSS